MNIIKGLLHKLLNKVLEKVSVLDNKLLKEFYKTKDYPYEELTPKEYEKSNEYYCEVLQWALLNNNIKNVALTGIYGSGKSTILSTFKSLHKEYKYLSISLADFKNEVDGDLTENNDECIEKHILQQMFYKVRYKDIPYSRFKRINNIKTLPVIKILMSIFTLIVFLKPNLINMFAYRIALISKEFNISKLSICILMIIVLIILLNFFTKIIKSLVKEVSLSKLTIKIKDTETELENSHESIFNKYLDEIIYFFEVTKHNVIIFEDLDRFNSLEIFSKLRQLNLLINNCEQVPQKVVFIYALKDSMFNTKDKVNKETIDDKISYKNRTKFFDFIIPVLQVVNSSNACDVLLEKIRNSKEKDFKDISEDLIIDLTYLINDMRVIKNIYNEFLIYKNNLKLNMRIDEERQGNESREIYKSKEDINKYYEKLLAIIVYKNLYPVDFSKLQNDEGMLYDIFNNKSELVSEVIDNIDKESNNVKKKIKIAKNEILENLDELIVVYENKINKKGISYSREYINGRYYSFEDILRRDDELNEFLEEVNGRDDEKELVLIIKEYKRRKEVLKLKEDEMNEVIKNLQRELDNLRNKKRIIRSLPLRNILNEYNLQKIRELPIFNEELLMFLLKRGYINENYYEYISYFYEGTLTPCDKVFLQNVTFEKCVQADYTLKKPKTILKKLKDYQFEKEYILNYDLVDYIIKNKDRESKYKNFYNLLIRQLVNESESSFKFVNEYISITKYNNIFIKSLCKNWSNIWIYVKQKTEANIYIYLRQIIKYADIEDIVKMNEGKILSKDICQMPDFLELINEEKYLEKIKEVVIKLDIKLNYISEGHYDEELLKFIYEENRYKINKENIELFLTKYSKVEISDLKKANYSTIIRSNCDCLINYINRNINEYIERVLLKLDTNKEESEEIIIELLNNEDILEINKIKIIENESFIISLIEKIPNNLWNRLLELLKVKISWNNILTYYKKFGLNNILAELFNNSIYRELSPINIDDFSEDKINRFGNEIILCNEIKDEYFEKLILILSYNKYDLEYIKDTSKERVEILIKNKLIELNNSNYNILKENFSKISFMLLEINFDQYLKEIDNYEVDIMDKKLIIQSKYISDNQKNIFIKSIDVNDIEGDTELINDIESYIVEVNNNLDRELDNKLIQVTIKYRLDSRLTDTTLEYIIMSNAEIENKIKIFTSQIKHLNNYRIKSILKRFKEPYCNIVLQKTRATIENNSINKELALELEKIKFISSLKEEGNNIRLILNSSH